MTFLKRVEARTKVQASDWKEAIALYLLSDVVGSEAEEKRKDVESEAGEILWKKLRGNLTENTDSLIKEYALKREEFLPLKLVEDISAAYNKAVGVSLEDLYNEKESWGEWAALAACGGGVSPTDDGEEFYDWYGKKTGKDKKNYELGKRNMKLFESPYAEGADLVDALIDAIEKEDE